MNLYSFNFIFIRSQTRIVKITFGDEIRRVKMPTTVILLEELKARLLCLFPALAALHCESDSNDISINLMFKEIAIVREYVF